MTLLTVKQVADRLPYGRSTVYDMIRRGELPAHRGGDGRGKIVVFEEELEEWIRSIPSAGGKGEIHELPASISLG